MRQEIWGTKSIESIIKEYHRRREAASNPHKCFDRRQYILPRHKKKGRSSSNVFQPLTALARLCLRICWVLSEPDWPAVAHRDLRRIAVIEGFARHNAIDFCTALSACGPLGVWRRRHTCQDVLESQLNIACVESRSLDERKVVLAYSNQHTLLKSGHGSGICGSYWQIAWPPP